MQSAEASSLSPVSIVLKALGSWNFRPDLGHGMVALILKHTRYAEVMILLPFTLEEGIRVPRHWTSAWDYIVAWPGHQDLSRGQWELLSQTFRMFYYFAHERRETIVAWPSFLQTYLLLGEMGKCFGEVVATCGDMQLVLLIAWANSRLPESLWSFPTLFQRPGEVEEFVNVDQGGELEGKAEDVIDVDSDVLEGAEGFSDWQYI